MRRRSFLKGMLGAAAAPTLTPSDMARVAPLSYRMPRGLPTPLENTSKELLNEIYAYQNRVSLFQKIKEAYHQFNIDEHYERFSMLHRIERLDADIASSRAFSLSAKIRMQRDRDWSELKSDYRRKAANAAQMMSLMT